MSTLTLGLGDLGVSYIRTAVPPAVAAGGTWLGNTLGIEVPGVAEENAVSAAFFLLWAAWYGVFRLLEQRWPKLGVFLGVPAAPVYDLPPAETESRNIYDSATGELSEIRSVTRWPRHSE